jgi:hypothetical protein
MPEATRGHGDSDKPEHGYRLEDQAAERTIGLVLMDTFWIISGDPGLIEFRAELEQLEDRLISPRGPRRPRLAAAR